MSRRCKEVNFVLESADYSNLVHTSRRMSLEMIFLCLVRMYVHSMDSNVLWTMTLRRWRRASKTSPRHHQHRHGTRRHDLEAWMGHLPHSSTVIVYFYTFTPFTWTALHVPTVSLSILYTRKYITFCRTPNRDQKRPLLWREHRHTRKMVTNMVVVSSTVTL